MGPGWFGRLESWLAPGQAALVDDQPVRPDVRPVLRRITAEALIRQDEAEQVLAMVRRHESLGLVAPRSGPLVRRFFALRDALPVGCWTADDVRIRDALSVILHHHAMVVSMAQDLLAYEWRSERIRRQVETFDGLGAPARLLDALYAELTTETVTHPR